MRNASRITTLRDAENHYWEKRENIWWKRLGALICAVSATFSLWVITSFVLAVWG